MKLTINKLIANDIINYGLERTSSFNYSVSLSKYLDEYDEKDKKYILDNLEEIFDDIAKNEVVAEVTIEEYDNDKHFYMTYYWGTLLSEVEKIVYENANHLNIKLDFEEIRDIANDILDDDEFNDDLVNKIKSYPSRDMEMN